MSTETLEDMQNRYTVLFAATDAKTGQRMFTKDAKYARDVMALGVEIQERAAAEASRPQINTEQLAWLDRVQAAIDPKTGRRPFAEMSPAGSTLRKNVEVSRQKLLEGGTLSQAVIADTERVFSERGAPVPETGGPQLTLKQLQHRAEQGMSPGPHWSVQSGAGAINTQRGPQS